MHLPDFLKEDWMKKTVIRPSTEDEIPILKELIITAYSPIEPILGRKPRGMKETEEKLLERVKNQTVYSVLIEGELVATFTMKLNEKYNMVEISKVAVRTDKQNKGIGSFIMESVEQMTRLKDERKIMIQTYDDHKQLVDFYRHRGYKTFDTKERFGNIVLMMEKSLWRED